MLFRSTEAKNEQSRNFECIVGVLSAFVPFCHERRNIFSSGPRKVHPSPLHESGGAATARIVVTLAPMVAPGMRVVLRTSVVALAFAMGSRSATCRAEERPLATLDYSVEAGASCPDEPAFRTMVTTRLGRDPFVSRAPSSVRVRFSSRGRVVVARIEIAESGSAPGVRTLEQPKHACEALAGAVAAAVATAIDPAGPIPASSSELPPLPPPASTVRGDAPHEPAVRQAPAVVSPVVAERAGPAPRVALTAHALGSVGVVPGPALGALAGVGIRYGAFALHAEGRFETTPAATLVTASDRLTGVAYTGSLVPCGLVRWFEGCIGVRLGALQVTSLDVIRPTLTRSVSAALLARAVARLPLTSGVLFRVGLEGGVPLVRTTFSVEGEPVWTAPAAHASLFIGIELLP